MSRRRAVDDLTQRGREVEVTFDLAPDRLQPEPTLRVKQERSLQDREPGRAGNPRASIRRSLTSCALEQAEFRCASQFASHPLTDASAAKQLGRPSPEEAERLPGADSA